ncbi:MAG: hypothetical protein FJX29_14170 [Alphaproteobacteria bacterium]|nr:hypothetical protein [Alphaproteobacteria bacterium]
MNSITHHPDEAALIDYANDTLDEAASLVIAAHVALCPDCQRSVRAFECIGGALLGALDPNTSSGSPDFHLLDRTPANLDHASAAEPAAAHAAAETNLPSAAARSIPRRIGNGLAPAFAGNLYCPPVQMACAPSC